MNLDTFMGARWCLIATLALTLALSDHARGQRRAATAPELVEHGAAAMKDRRFGDALEAFTAATKLAPRDPNLWFAAGAAAFMMGRNDDAEASLSRALKLDPSLVEAAGLLGDVQYRGGRVKEAIATYEAALAHAPDDEVLKNRLAEWRQQAQHTDRAYESRGAHFRVLFEGPAEEALARRAVEMLEAHYWRIGSALTAYPPQTITVVFYTERQFRDITRAPAWAAGGYDGRIHVPVRGALERPEELDSLLGHEFVHAVVAMLGGRNVPAWLNEGLASVFERDGLDEARATLARTAVRHPLRQLHGTFNRLSGEQAAAAYAISTVAVRKMFDIRGAHAVVNLLQDLARGAQFAPAFHQNIALPYEDFQRMVATEVG